MMKTLQDGLRPTVQMEAAGALIDDCPRCHGAKMVYVKRPYFIGTRYYGDLDEFLQCPDCAPVQCENCQDTGVVRYQLARTHPDFGRMFPCPNPGCRAGREEGERIRRAALRSAEMPEEYKGLTLATWDRLPPALRAGKELARAAAGQLVDDLNGKREGIALSSLYEAVGRTLETTDRRRLSLVFQGSLGTGKTGLAAAIANALLERNHSVLYMRVRDMIQEIQGRYGKEEAPSAEDVLAGIQRAPILILDEFNISAYTPDRVDRMESVIRYRHNNALPTVVTLNDSWDMVEANWGGRTASALRAMAHWILMEGRPIRHEGHVLSDGGRR